MEQLHRRVPRHEAGWPARCTLDEGSGPWAECRVLDISVIGVGVAVGVEIAGPRPRDLIGRRMVVEMENPAGTAGRLRLLGEVRNTGPGRNGGIRLGLEFADLSGSGRAVLDLLEAMPPSW